MKKAYLLFPLLLICTGAGAQTIVDVDTSNSSGRIGDNSLDGVDWQFGTADAVTAATGDLVAYNNSLLGDNPANIKFGQLWRFDATSDFADDFNNGYSIELNFTSGLVNAGGGAPDPVEIYFLTSGATAVREDAANSSGTLLGTIDGGAANTAHNFTVTGISSLAAGDRIWIGLSSDLSNNNTANNIFIAGDGNFINAELATVIPEPSAFALLGGLLALSAVALRRRGRA